MEDDVPVIHKTEELLANMHIVLVKKVLRIMKKEKLTSSVSLSVHGILLVRQQGTMLCSMKMPVVDVSRDCQSVTDYSTLSITMESAMGGLNNDIVCSSIT